MEQRYDVYENADVHLRQRRQVAALSTVMLGAVAATVLLMLGRERWALSIPTLGLGVLIVWGSSLWWTGRRLAELQRRVWCLKVSDDELVGYNYARRRTCLRWCDLRRVDIQSDLLRVTGPDDVHLEIPSCLDDSAHMGHRVTELAEKQNKPVHVDGQPWEEVDVRELFPFLAGDPPTDAPGRSDVVPDL